MKKFFAIVVALFTLSIVAHAEIYPQAFIVSEINYEEGILILDDCCGYTWIWEGIEDYSIGDVVAAIVDDNDTEFLFDDELVKIKYAGYIEGWV